MIKLTPEELDVIDEAIHKEGVYYEIEDDREAWLYFLRKYNEAQLKKVGEWLLAKRGIRCGECGQDIFIGDEEWQSLLKEAGING